MCSVDNEIHWDLLPELLSEETLILDLWPRISNKD